MLYEKIYITFEETAKFSTSVFSVFVYSTFIYISRFLSPINEVSQKG